MTWLIVALVITVGWLVVTLFAFAAVVVAARADRAIEEILAAAEDEER